MGTWNYNLSHHGKYVGIASHPKYLVGCDIVDLSTRTRVVKSCASYLELFRNQLSQYERDFILSQQSEQWRYNMFFIIWSLKEAYVKAIGQGLGFDCQSVYFKVQYRYGDDEESMTEDEAAAGASGYGGFESELLKGSAVAVIQGKESKDWRFRFQSIDISHIITVALGPLQAAIPSYREALWGKALESAGTDLSSAACELSAWAAEGTPLPIDRVSLASLLNRDHIELIRNQFSEIPVSPPYLDLNNRGDQSCLVFSTVEERLAASNSNTPAVQEPHFLPFSPDAPLVPLDEDEETQEAPWKMHNCADSETSAADREWSRPPGSPSQQSVSTISISDIPTAGVNDTTETNVSFASLDINSPAAWREEYYTFTAGDTAASRAPPAPPERGHLTTGERRGVLGATTQLHGLSDKPHLSTVVVVGRGEEDGEEAKSESETSKTPLPPSVAVPFCICM